MRTDTPLYDDLVVLVDRVISISIESNKKLYLRQFYDAYRALDDFNDTLNQALHIPCNRNLELATLKCRHFLLKLGEIRLIHKTPGMIDLPIERFIRHKSFYGIARDQYDCGRIEQDTSLFRRKVMIMPGSKRPITDQNSLTLVDHVENIEDIHIRERLISEGKTALKRLRTVQYRMERYIMKHATLNDLMVGVER